MLALNALRGSSVMIEDIRSYVQAVRAIGALIDFCKRSATIKISLYHESIVFKFDTGIDTAFVPKTTADFLELVSSNRRSQSKDEDFSVLKSLGTLTL
jgi:hypothetical protein